MAEKRMLSNRVIDTDLFLDMPATTQNLYFHLNMKADDDGFNDKVRTIMRNVRASQDDLNVLKAKRFIIDFDNGVIVIRHWKINNYLRKDRYKQTQYIDEKQQLTTTNSGAYEVGIPTGVPSVTIDKNRLGKVRLEENSIEIEQVNPKHIKILNHWNSKNIIQHKINNDIKKAIDKRLKEISVENMLTFIDRYATILSDKEYYFNHKWSLKDFLNRRNGISDFADDGSKWVSYMSEKKSNNQCATNSKAPDFNIESV